MITNGTSRPTTKGQDTKDPIMTTQSEALKALADRVEREEPSRELDAAVDLALGFCPHINTTYEAVQGDSGRTCDDCGADSWGNRNAKGRRLHDPAPTYTTSLDAAVTLVPPDCWRETNGPRKYLNVPTPSPNRWKAEVTPWITGLPCMGWAETEAMAICAAALRARAALSPTDEGTGSGR